MSATPHSSLHQHPPHPSLAETFSDDSLQSSSTFERSQPRQIPHRFGAPHSSPSSPPVAYPNWSVPEAPLQPNAIQAIFAALAQRFGFQHSSMLNMSDHLLTMLDSRAARMSPMVALWSLHADYIGGEHANYRKWCFAAQLDLEDGNRGRGTPTYILLEEEKKQWRERMETMSDHTRVSQLALYLLIWGEASTLRYCPELICFLFSLADDAARDTNAPEESEVKEGDFLDNVVAPLYRFARDQSYEIFEGRCVRRERDHNDIVGYDDINQLFWDRRAIHRLQLQNGTILMKDVARSERFAVLKDVDWSRAFRKTFYESRSWLHLLTNFSRFWIIHATSFWYYMAANVDFLYDPSGKNLPLKLTIIGLGGMIAVLLMMAATLAEFKYLTVTRFSASILLTRLAVLFLLAALHAGASIYVIRFGHQSTWALIVASVQLGLGAIIAIVLAIQPSSNLFHARSSHHHLACKTFTANFPAMSGDDRYLSILLWICVFGCKFLETYFFLALSFRDALVATSTMRLQNCRSDPLLGSGLCLVMPILTSVLMFVVELVLFFLDTYLWYVIWNTLFSVIQALRIGISIMTSWKTLFARLPRHMYNKIAAAPELCTKSMRKVACSQMWNAIVISMYRDHLISDKHLQSLLYKVEEGGVLRTPSLLDAQSDTQKEDCFPIHSEAERRLSFFAQSLATQMPPPCAVAAMPVFTVFTPHYAEKMLLSLREIIREEDPTTRVTLLEYLKRLHPTEWSNFVQDTKFISEEDHKNTSAVSEKDDLPFYCIGFKSSAPEYILRTRVWASLRAQTLYRTVSGFMNYARALKMLHRVEHPSGTADEDVLDKIAHDKFRFLVAMQRYSQFDQEEAENCDYLLTEFPHLQIAYIEQQLQEGQDEPVYYSVLIDGFCERDDDTKKRLPRYRIRLPGNPILGDGKSDNQNHALIFYRGEYLQLVDANQDNYLEECLKIRSIFGEFDQKASPDPFSIYALSQAHTAPPPVAIVGAREYIFSENVGVLGDIAAGKEQTFGTLTQRIMAKTGGRLHYGHPDYLNAVYMTTRGGVSKAQRGLHLNEDIYAGMNALSRGGRIKHTEYLQCGKGRDLGFCSILNFTTKIGSGMGEQMLSREYYYLGTQLPIDRFLTFYYAHPGFHMNNIMIIFAVQVFLFCMTLVGTMTLAVPGCHGNHDCFRAQAVYDWLERCILSIFMVFFIAFLPLFLQELTEKGTLRSIWRLAKQFLSWSPLFEVFVTQIYANSVLSNLSFGGARYIATGRGFATARLPFSELYARFANPSIYFGARTMFLLCFVSLTLWIPHLLYFWATVLSLLISPYVFNPHQFVLMDFITDYRAFLGWLSRGNGAHHHAHAWITFCRQWRTRVTGHRPTTESPITPRPQLSSIFASEMIMPLLQAALCGACYVFIKTYRTDTLGPTGAFGRIICVAVGPIAWNALILLLLQCGSMIFAALASRDHGWGQFMAGTAHGAALLGLVVFFEYFWALETFDVRSTLLGLLAIFALQRFIFKTVIALFLTRELHDDSSNRTWWSGHWRQSKLGLHGAREYVCKIVEMSMFTTDFILGHLILFVLFPLTLVPYIDKLHSMMLFWLRPSRQIRSSILSTKQRRRRRQVAMLYGPIFFLVFCCFAALLVLPPQLYHPVQHRSFF